MSMLRRTTAMIFAMGLGACVREPPPPGPVHDGPGDLSSVKTQIQTQLPILARMACLSAAAYVDKPQPAVCQPFRQGRGLTIQHFRVTLPDVLGNTYTGDYTILIDDNHHEQIIAVRGTDELADWYTNLHFVPIMDDILNVYVHRGFRTYARAVYNDLLSPNLAPNRTRLHRDYETYLTGHSLGGGVAVLVGLYLHVDGQLPISGIYTFGQPRVFDNNGATSWPQLAQIIYHVENCDDPVPLVPIGDDVIHTLIINTLSPSDEVRQYEHLGHEILLLNPGKYWIPGGNEIVRNPIREINDVIHDVRAHNPTPHDIFEYIAKLEYLQSKGFGTPTNPAYQFAQQCGVFLPEPAPADNVEQPDAAIVADR